MTENPYGSLGKWDAQANNPAAPEGARQAAVAGASYDDKSNPYSTLGKWMSSTEQNPYTANAASWYTGFNAEGTNNGWNTDFTKRFIEGQNAAAQAGTLATYFEDGGTGVVTWDHTSADEQHQFEFGDIYDNGHKVGNVYEMYDKGDADLAMVPWLFDGKQQARMFSDSDPTNAIAAGVADMREQNNTEIPKALEAAETQGKIDARTASFAEGGSQAAIVGGAAAGGAATGAATGAALTAWLGPGAAAGAAAGGLIGGVVGGVGGFLNRDELDQQAARAYEITALAHEQNGLPSAIATGAEQWAGFTTHLTSPLQQAVHGATEFTGENKRGDLQSAFYAVDGKGESTAPVWAKGLGLAAAVGDGLLQFASPLSRAIYTAQMGTTIAGESVNLAMTGTMFDQRDGRFDNVFKDDEGHFDPVSGAAGIMKIGIDAVQLGGWRALARTSGLQAGAVDAGREPLEAAGHRFILNEAGEITGKQRTMALLAPSEQVAWANATRKARVAALAENRAVTADDLYKAANGLATGGNKMKAALVNGFGEGYEEVAQSIFESMATDNDLSLDEIRTSFLYGAAGGIGMSLGATVDAPTSDARMSAMAYATETIRRGEVPDRAAWDAQWASLSHSEKRVMAGRSKTDAAMMRSALDRMAKDQSATLVASNADAAKAIDARRKMVDKDLKRGGPRTDAYHVMSGQVDAGRVDADGNLLGDTIPGEALEASALTIHRLLENRLRGLGFQAQALTDRIAELTAKADPELQAKIDEASSLLASIEGSRLVGADVLDNVAAAVNAIYDENTTEADAQSYTRDLNRMLEEVFRGTAPLAAPEGFTGTAEELQLAGAQFGTLLQAREPKLDAGSYLAMMPRASWELTRTRSDNVVQVNTDVLAAINGDFDGDKLRAENQLVLSNERFAQVRAGQNFGGAVAGIDMAVRNFDAALDAAMSEGLTAGGAMQAEADAVLANIENAIGKRYARDMSPAALSRVIDDFTTALHAGTGEARTTLLNALAREAGEAITNRGRTYLNNEWLWASKVVRANLQAFQTSYAQMRDPLFSGASGPTPTEDVADFQTPEGINRRKDRAVNDAQTLAVFAAGNTLFRKFQKIHYTLFNSAVLSAAQTEPADVYEMAEFYAELSRGVTRTELSRVSDEDTIAARVQVMLRRLVEDAMRDPEFAGKFNPSSAMSVLANVKVKDVWFSADGEPVTNDQNLSLAQVLLKRALDAEREEHFKTFDSDEKLQAKHARLRALTFPNETNDGVNAQRAFLEVFGAAPFIQSLGGITGELAPHTTPEQWLRLYTSLDANGRTAMERQYKNVPEYLNRKEVSDPPYSFAEASRREVSGYRAMLDAMIAVGRAMPKERARVSKQAETDFMAGHELIRSALLDFRKITNRRAKDRAGDVALIQQMFEANPQRGREILEMIPDSAANALFDYRDDQLYVVPWIYEMFAIEKPEEAAFFYWKNLTLAQWNATKINVREDDSDAPGRAYNKLQSRFQRLMYQFAKEPGQPRLEQLIRQMDEAKSLDQFFDWLNTAPGMKGNFDQADLLPFNDDVADFEADAGGGWIKANTSGDLRTAIAAMRVGAQQLADTMSFRQVSAATDREILDGIKLARANDPSATKLHHEHLRQLTKAVQASIELPRGFAPTAMLALGRGVMRSFDPHSTDKGMSPDSFHPLGEFQALMDAFAFVPELERVMEALTAHSLGSLRTNVGDLAKYAGSAMDSDGRPIEWHPMTVDQAIEMLDDSRTAPLAHALLTPSAMDITPAGVLSERLLMEASLKDLLDDGHYKALFDDSSDGALDRAMRYLSLVDSRARHEGGHFDVMRMAHDRAIARTSSLGRPATEDDNDRLLKQSYMELARDLQMVGQIQATPEMRDGGVLASLRKQALEALKVQRQARGLPSMTDDTGEVITEWVDQLLQDLENEHQELKQGLIELYTGAELTRHTEALAAQYQQNADRIRGVLEDDTLGALVTRFHVTGDEALDRAAHAQIVEYVRTMTAFPARAPEAADAWRKLANQLVEGREPKLSVDEWAKLAHGSMGVALADSVLKVAGHVAMPAFPKGDPATSAARFFKYFDPNYSFIVSDLLDEDSPVTAAAVWLHRMAEQPETVVPIDSMVRTLNSTVLNRSQLGTWTPGLMSQIVESHQRMDSAAAGEAIAAAGNGPKRWAAISAATRRTYSKQVPTPDLLTSVSFTGDLLGASAGRFTEIPVTPAGAVEASSMPVAQLDNRFFSAVRVNGTEIPLDSENLGYQWNDSPEDTPFRYVALDRLEAAVRRQAKRAGLPMDQVTVEVDFFHPDSQPDGAEWQGNAFFEGMSHSLLPDGSESLIATLWSDNGGQISAATQWPLDAGKKGLRAIEPFVRVDETAQAEADALWTVGNDFAGMLRRKTELLAERAEGASYNALYKHMKLSHIAVGKDARGNPMAMSAEEVIAFQVANGKATPLPMTDAKLVTLSPDVLRTMLGETGDQGVNRFFEDEYLLNPDLVSPYTGISETMLDRFGAGWVAEVGSIGQTSLAHVGAQRALTVRTMLTDEERNARQDRIDYLNNRAADVGAKRHRRLEKAEVRKGYLAALQLASGSITAERSTFDFPDLPLAPRDITEANHSKRLLEAMRGIENPDSFQRGFSVVDQGSADYPGGRLTVESFGQDRDLEHHVVKGDLAVVLLNTFERPERTFEQAEARMEKALNHLATSGATIALGSGNGGGDLRFSGARYLQSRGYAPVRGSKHLWAPVEFSMKTQNERAYESTLTERRRIRPARNIITALFLDPIGTDENNAIQNPRSMKLRDRKILNNILPTATFPHYNLPMEDGRETGLYARTLAHLRSITDPGNAEYRQVLTGMAGADPAHTMPIAEALDRFHAKITRQSSLELEPGSELKVGDIIPLVHPNGRVILYRHGFALPEADKLGDLLATGGLNVALAPSKVEDLATANDGIIRNVRDRAGFGRTVVLESDLQPYGNKVQLEANGMKYVVVPPADADLAAYSQVFANGTVVDLFADVASADSKEAIDGRVWNYRNALAFFQYDFTDDLVQFFFPDEATRDPQARLLTVNLLHRLANQRDLEIPLARASELSKFGPAMADAVASFAAGEATNNGVPGDWADRLADPQHASDQIAAAVITYLLTPGAHVDNVLKSAGFSHKDAADDNVTTQLVPGLFADLLDRGLDSPVHAELIRRFDAQLHSAPDGSGMRLHPNWVVEIFDASGGSKYAYLQFGEAHSSGDNPLLDGQAFNPTGDQATSAHNAMAAAGSLGAITAHKVLAKSRAFARSFSRGAGVSKLGSGDSMWQMLTDLPNEEDVTFEGWRRETAGEISRRAAAREELVGFYAPLNTDDWTPEHKAEYEREALKVLDRLNLYGSQIAMVDTWVRLHLGSPHGIDDNGNELGAISGGDAIEQVKIIRENLKDRLLPTAGAMVPLLDVNHLTTIYQANLNRTDGRGWGPRVSLEKGSRAAESWDEWVDCSFGTAWIMKEGEEGLVPEKQFDQLFLLAVDGLMHGYQGATSATRQLPVSSDVLQQRALMDPETNRRLVSIAADENLLATDPTLFNASRAELDDIIAGQRIYADGRHGADPASAKGRKVKYIDRWRNEVDAPRQVGKTMRGVRAPGQTFIGHTTTTSAFWRSMINLKVGKSLFNVSLVVSAPVEAFYRRTINTVANVATGEATGAVGQMQSRIADRFKDKTIGKIAEQLGFMPTFTGDQQQQLNKLVDALSTRSDFKAMIYKELMFQYPSMPGIGKVEKALEKFAKFGGRMQDPAWGMLPKDLARIYVETVMSRISAVPVGENIYSVERLLASMARDPGWIEENDHEAHNMAIARISNIRSLKPNVLSLGTRGFVEPLSQNPKFLWNSAGNMIKVMTVFQNFWSNYAINIAGLQGAADFVAFMLDGKEKSKLLVRMQNAMAGTSETYTASEHYDMSEVLESMDLADSFIRGGVTHTALFALGMLAGGLNLSGEDDETKWRRRQAALQGAGFVQDPRQLQNDFRNRDSIYLNWLPMGLDSLFRIDPNDESSQSMAQMNWITRSLLSPIIGFERFYNTGDFTEVIHGFTDAIGSHPIVNEQLWNATSDTVAELHAQANSAAENGDHVAANHFLVTAVGVLDSYMLENSMINMMYVGADRYDRDPYKLEKIDSDGNQQQDVRGNPYATDVLNPFSNEEGDFQEGYVARDEYGANVRALSENRFGVALLGSIFTGFTGGGFTGSDMFRQNMAVKERQLELQPSDPAIVKAEVLAAMQGYMKENGSQPFLTSDELSQKWKNDAAKAGKYVDWGKLENAAIKAAEQGLYGTGEGIDLSTLDQAGNEELTLAGKQAIVQGLRSGSVHLGDAALAGVFLTTNDRAAIQDQWMKQLTQEGVDLGLSPSQATSRMKRIFFGPYNDPDAKGIYDLLWDENIPKSDTVRYNQLNTTYVMGPSGYPMATGFTRDGFFGALGLKPVNRAWSSTEKNMGTDARGNAVDELVGINTGLRALEMRPNSWEIPSTEDEIRAAAEKMADAIGDLNFSPQDGFGTKSGGSGYGHGGGGGYSGSGYSDFSKMYSLPHNTSSYGNSIPFINTSNPIIRRTYVRRERVWSERGRLKQWQ